MAKSALTESAQRRLDALLEERSELVKQQAKWLADIESSEDATDSHVKRVFGALFPAPVPRWKRGTRIGVNIGLGVAAIITASSSFAGNNWAIAATALACGFLIFVSETVFS